MRTNIRPFLRFAAFFLVLALAVALANTCLIQTDTFVALMMDELKNSRNIELAVVGSSIVRDHFNAALISEQTGRKAFSAAVPGLSLQGELALTRELYRQNSPEYTVLVVEPYNFNTAKEDPNAFFKLSPFLSGIQNRLTYFMDTCREDGDYLNRLFLFREFGAESPADVFKTVALRLNAQSEYARLRPTMDSTVAYAGGGFLRHTSGESAETLIRETVLREPDPGYPCELFDASKAFLARYKALCAEKGSRLIVVLSPNLTAHALAEPGFLPYGESLMRYCRENDIPCFNFQYAKAEYLQNLDGYYYDLYHMNGTGADLFSAFFARFFNAYTSGEDISGWFYADQAQYLASIDRITNVWLSVGEDVYIADCNRGTLVTPQYRFVSVAADGTETTLLDDGESDTISAALVPPRSVVGFYMDKGVETVVGFMGAVYAGCAYAQLNLRHPAPRVRAMLETLDTPIVVTDRAHLAQLEGIEPPARILLIEELEETPPDAPALAAVRAQMIDADPLYVNFTSGSTGTPKGVVVCHRNVCEFIPCFAETFAITEKDVLANQAPFDFDVSVKDIYSGLFTGARVEIVPTAYFTNPTKLMDFLCDRSVTLMVWAVSALCFLTTMNALAYKTPTTLRAILFSGEVMPIKHLHKLQKYLPDVQYVNLYGPTEITCNCTYYVVDREFAENESLPIGVPFKNERILLLTPDGGEAVKPGEIGELCVSGTSVALGYYKDAERTAASFTQNPLNHAYIEPIYRTGDLVRVNERGEMVYVSRKDFQIKHMGHRIELSEIEVQMTAVPGVERALCAYLADKGKILAFYTGEADKAAITGALREILPGYMIPNLFMQVDAMPLNKNGKIDRAALLERYAAAKAAKKEARHG